MSCYTAALHRAATMPDTQTAQNLQGCMHTPISFCSPSHKTTDTTTETCLSKIQILLLLLFMREQEKSLVLLGAFQYLYFRVWHPFMLSFPNHSIRPSLLLSVWSGVKLSALSWASRHSYTLSAHPTRQQLESNLRQCNFHCHQIEQTMGKAQQLVWEASIYKPVRNPK